MFVGQLIGNFLQFILAHRLQRDMTSYSLIEVLQDAVDRTGMDQVLMTDRTRLLSDNGPGYVSRAFRNYLGMVDIRHILASPFPPSDQRQAGALPPDPQARREPTAV